MKITIETDNDGKLTIQGNIKDSSFNVNGYMPLAEDEFNMFTTLRTYSRELSTKCPSDFIYSQSGASK